MSKALTICQPYAELILTRKKRVENRTWSTKYRGPLCIHAGKSLKYKKLFQQYNLTKDDMDFGAVIATANLVACIHIDFIKSYYFNYPWLEGHLHAKGPWCWILEDIKPIDFSWVIGGKLGLWNID